MKANLKRKKAPDMEGWSYEMVINAGKDLEHSIRMMINKLLENNEIPSLKQDKLVHFRDFVHNSKPILMEILCQKQFFRNIDKDTIKIEIKHKIAK